jgi:hypothetical protein
LRRTAASASYYAGQSWQPANYNSTSGGSRYPTFVDRKNGIGGAYINGKVVTWSLNGGGSGYARGSTNP